MVDTCSRCKHWRAPTLVTSDHGVCLRVGDKADSSEAVSICREGKGHGAAWLCTLPTFSCALFLERGSDQKTAMAELMKLAPVERALVMCWFCSFCGAHLPPGDGECNCASAVEVRRAVDAQNA